MRNSTRKAIGRIWSRIFDPWWDFYYKYFNHPPRCHCKDDSWIIEHWDENPHDPVCFPLPFWVNCFGCNGCSSVKNPPFHPDKRKGLWKVLVTETFCSQYEDLAGKDALFELLWNLEKHNMEVDEIKA